MSEVATSRGGPAVPETHPAAFGRDEGVDDVKLARLVLGKISHGADRIGIDARSPVVATRFTNGFGNNIFQYVAGRLLAERRGVSLRVAAPRGYYGLDEFAKLGIELLRTRSARFDRVVTNDTYAEVMAEPPGRAERLLLRGNFEDYRHYLPHLEQIRSWFRPVTKRTDRDLGFHFRSGDRLFMREEFDWKPRVADYLAAIEQFDFDRLHIVSDLPEWRTYSEDELRELNFHRDVSGSGAVPISESAAYLNEMVEGLSQYQPVFQSTSVAADFDYLRTFDQVLFEHGTLSWWAAVLSGASKVGVYGPWRPWRGEANRNLSQVPLPGWFQWDKLTPDPDASPPGDATQ